MLSERRSTNPESFSKFGRGRRMNLATSYGHTHKTCLNHHVQERKEFLISNIHLSKDIRHLRKDSRDRYLSF